MSFTRPDSSWVLEGVMTTIPPASPDATDAPDGVNIAPMGPIVPAANEQGSFDYLVLRPFRTSTTYRNLKATGVGVFHVTDDVLLLARAVMRRLPPVDKIPTFPASHVTGVVLADACRYHELRVEELDDHDERTTIRCRVVHHGRLRDFFGFNRARHAVLEAAILATRLHMTGPSAVLAEYERLRVMVDKTGGPNEHLAMTELTDYVRAADASEPVL